jgi:hypothetical protein
MSVITSSSGQKRSSHILVSLFVASWQVQEARLIVGGMDILEVRAVWRSIFPDALAVYSRGNCRLHDKATSSMQHRGQHTTRHDASQKLAHCLIAVHFEAQA